MAIERKILLHSKGKDYPVETSLIHDDLKNYIWRHARVYVDRDEHGWVMEQKLDIFGICISKDMHCLPAGSILKLESYLPILAVNQSTHYLVETAEGHTVAVGDSSSSSVGLYRVTKGVNTAIVEGGVAEIFYITIWPKYIDRLCKMFPEMRRFKRWMDFNTTSRVHDRNISMNHIRETAKRRMLDCQDLRPFGIKYIHRNAINFMCNFMNELVEGSGEEISQLERDYAQEIAEAINSNLGVFDIESYLAARFNKNFQDLNDHFQAVMHCTIHHYLKMERMDWAYMQLLTTIEEEETIASMCGYLPCINPDGSVSTADTSFERFKKDFREYYRLSVMDVRTEHN
ncbi:helix-turn-helix transcriptional regulator [Chitinophaga jiangningensis]|nr:AraC family transcriptional regulator [Chitinophaga jiangningensis]